MNILKRIEEKCVEKTYEVALSTMEKTTDECLFIVWYEPEYPSELLENEE